ncbi:helix-turn-helix transcriptional regulator [Motiliproteus sp. MSK22-1]|uniref:helix-turn-helix domain-containing protein n=1 Tax=Motiliproteus sp. MSK22-1 TaxID=1897630 RepID=UPI000975B302|nr:helix-turn-helix transcriptional regulator [Motiliproteus sp. MSK22-1]OMH25901.1 transcriptional regulator [Motiliproteus sp. MSK22-1]
MREDFSKNLRLLCSYYKSIAEVCRKIPINRSQFNKYLCGSSLPSKFILRRICDFFGVEEYEIFLPHQQFAQIVQVRPSDPESQDQRAYVEHIDKLQAQAQGRFDKYLGYYFEIYYSMAFPGKILRNLVEISAQGDSVYYQRIERSRADDGSARICHGKYLGCAFFLSDRIFMVDYETLTGNEMTQTILYPTYKNRINRLAGLRLGVSASDRREPACARVIYEYLGQRVDLRKALRLCGLFSADTDTVDSGVKERISNKVSADDKLFLAVAL